MVVTTRRRLRSSGAARAPSPPPPTTRKTPAKTPRKTPARTPGRKKAARASGGGTDAPETAEDLALLHRDELRARLKSLGIPQPKVKQAMIDALVEHFAQSGNGEGAPSSADDDAAAEEEGGDDSLDESYVGRRLAKDFDGVMFYGTIDKFDRKHRLWHVTYDDGDGEELEFAELLEALDLFNEGGEAEEGTAEEEIEGGSAEGKRSISLAIPILVAVVAGIVWMCREMLLGQGEVDEDGGHSEVQENVAAPSAGMEGESAY